MPDADRGAGSAEPVLGAGDVDASDPAASDRDVPDPDASDLDQARSGGLADRAPEPPSDAVRYFGDRIDAVAELATLLAGDAVVRGLIGPREAPRLWDRHLLNCGVLGQLIPIGADVVDVGSGAGLPGLVLACARPDLTVRLVEPMLRRTAFLTDAIAELRIDDRVSVLRGRIDEPALRAELGAVRWMTARAVAPLDRLVGWCAPGLAPGGRLLAMKGDRAEDELSAAKTALRAGRATASVVECGVGVVDPPTRVVVVERRG
jgi:16S rRNA (guanine527-N7)-methyltransferase